MPYAASAWPVKQKCSFILCFRTSLLFALCEIFFPIFVSAQVPAFNFRQLGSEEGLNNPNIFNIQQNRNGVVYFTTQNGIYQFDGYTFSKLEIDSLKSNALETAVLEDEQDLFLSVRGEGLAKYSLHSGNYDLPEKLRVKNNNADEVVLTRDHVFLLTSQIKLVIIERNSGKVISDGSKRNEKNLPNCILKTREGRVLVGRSDGIYDVTSGEEQQLQALAGTAVFALAQNKESQLLAGTAGAIVTIYDDRVISQYNPVYEKQNTTFQLGGLKSINKIVADDYGRIWFTSYPGENVYLYAYNKVHDIFDILDIQPSLVNCLYKDSRQNIWIGTMSDGVYQLQNTFFNSFNFSYDNKILNINQVYLHGDLLVAATSNGLYGMNLRTNQTKILSQPDAVFVEPVYSITESGGALFYSKRNELSMSPSIFLDSRFTYRFRPISARKFLPLNRSESVLATWDGYIVSTTGDAANIKDTLISFSDYRITVNALLYRDSLLYIGTNDGLFTYDFRSNTKQHVVRDALNFSINDLAVVNNSIIAAHDGGLTDVKSRNLIRSAGKFALNTVRKIRAYHNQIWLGTLDGVYICDTLFNPLKILNKNTGLLSNSVSDISFDESRVAIATVRGVSVTDFKHIIRHSSRLPPVNIDYLKVGEEIVRSDDNTFVLPSHADDITLFFLSPVFNKNNKQIFRFRQNGGEWIRFENQTQLPFPTLGGGEHKIEIEASTDDINWSPATSVQLRKEQKFSEKPVLYWLITIGVLVVIALISFLVIRRIKNRARKRLTEEQQMNLLKHQAMNALLSPHFIFNSLTSIQNYINTNNSLRASEYLAKFSRLIRMIIEKAAQSHISLYDELARLTYYLELEKERFKNKFDYEIQISDDINTHEVMIPNMIIQPYVENSILHGILPTHAPGKLWISFNKVDSGRLIITIEDNGVGLIKAAEHAKTGHKSLGTSTIRSILEVNSKLTGKKQLVSMIDKSTVDAGASGTKITVELEL